MFQTKGPKLLMECSPLETELTLSCLCLKDLQMMQCSHYTLTVMYIIDFSVYLREQNIHIKGQ